MLLAALDWLARRRHRPGASSIWTAAAVAAFLVRHHQRRAAREAIVLREELREGQSLLITHTDVPRG